MMHNNGGLIIFNSRSPQHRALVASAFSTSTFLTHHSLHSMARRLLHYELWRTIHPFLLMDYSWNSSSSIMKLIADDP